MGWVRLKSRIRQWEERIGPLRWALKPVRIGKRCISGLLRRLRRRPASGPIAPAQPIEVELKTPLPKTLGLGRGQVLFITGWLRHADAAPISALLATNGSGRPEPVNLMGHGYCPLMPSLYDFDVGPHNTAFYGWVQIPGNFPEPELTASLLVKRHDGTIQELELGHTQLVRSEPIASSPRRGEAPLVAICMATYNPPSELFARQIESIRQQTHGNWVCFLSDDGSSPEALAQIRKVLGDDARFHFDAHGERLGFYHNFERAISQTPPEAEFVVLCDQDDCWYPHKLATLLSEFHGDDTMLVYSDMRIVDGAGNVLSNTFWNKRNNNTTNLASMIIANTVTGAASMFRRSLLERILPFPRKLGHQMYHDHWVAMVALACGKLRFLDQPLYDYVQHGANVIGHEGREAAQPSMLQRWINVLRKASDKAFLNKKLYQYLGQQHAAYYAESLRLVQMARVLELRCGDRLRGARRRAVRRLARLETRAGMAWMLLRGLPQLRPRATTLGLELHLFFPSLVWGRAWRAGINPAAVVVKLKHRRHRALKARQFLRDHGWYRTARRAARITLNRLRPPQPGPGSAPAADPGYAPLLAQDAQRLREERGSYREQIENFSDRPLISILVPIYNTPPHLFTRMVASVTRQIYSHWELILVDDGSPAPHVTKMLDVVKADPRVRIHRRLLNGNISAATNDGIRLAGGEFVAFLDHDDELAEDALFQMVKRVNHVSDADVLYSDQDKIDEMQGRREPFYKPDWSPELFRGVMYVGHLLMVRRKLLMHVGGCDSRFDGVQDFELALRLTEHARRVEHIPAILYHWRVTPGSLAGALDAKSRIHLLQAKAVQEQIDRLGLQMTAEPHLNHRVTMMPRPRASYPLVSVLLPAAGATADELNRCVRSLTSRTTYPNLEIWVGGPAPRGVSRHPVHEVAMRTGISRNQAYNRLARKAGGEFLLLLDPAIEPATPDWIERLLIFAEQPDVGAVGPMLTYVDRRVRSAGLVFSREGSTDHLMRGRWVGDDGYAGSLSCARDASGVSAACLLIAREKFTAPGGFDPIYSSRQADMDLGLRLARLGLRCVFAGGNEVVLHGADVADNYTDRVLLLDTWEGEVEGDPYLNPQFDAARLDYSLLTQRVAA